MYHSTLRLHLRRGYTLRRRRAALWMDGWMDGWLGGCLPGWLGWLAGWLGWLAGWLDGWMNEWRGLLSGTPGEVLTAA